MSDASLGDRSVDAFGPADHRPVTAAGRRLAPVLVGLAHLVGSTTAGALTWGPLVASPGAEGTTSVQDAAANERGDTAVVSQLGRRVVLRVRRGGGDWGPTTTVSTNTARQAAPRVALNERGDILVVWQSATQMNAALRIGSAPWRRQRVGAVGSRACCAVLGFSDVGRATVAWKETPRTGCGGSVRLAFAEPGRPWGPNPAGTLRTDGCVSLGVNAAGDATAAWTSAGPGRRSTVTSAIAPSGTGRWGTVTKIAQTALQDGAPAVSVAPNGRAAVAWIAAGRLEVAEALRGSASWVRSAGPDRDAGGATAGQPVLATDGAGSALLAWTDSRPSDEGSAGLSQLRASVRREGRWSAPELLADTSGGRDGASATPTAVDISSARGLLAWQSDTTSGVWSFDQVSRRWTGHEFDAPAGGGNDWVLATAPVRRAVAVTGWLQSQDFRP